MITERNWSVISFGGLSYPDWTDDFPPRSAQKGRPAGISR
jgi:hypothetical protein